MVRTGPWHSATEWRRWGRDDRRGSNARRSGPPNRTPGSSLTSLAIDMLDEAMGICASKTVRVGFPNVPDVSDVSDVEPGLYGPTVSFSMPTPTPISHSTAEVAAPNVAMQASLTSSASSRASGQFGRGFSTWVESSWRPVFGPPSGGARPVTVGR